MGGEKQDGVEYRVTYGPLPRPPFKMWLRNGFACWWRDMPFLVVGRLAKAATDWKSLTAGVIFLFFLVPPLYRFVVRSAFPHSYYYLGTLANPPSGFNDLLGQQWDMNWIDRGGKDQRWNRFATAQRQIAHIKKDHFIPGRTSASGDSDEAPGKIWTGTQCLFIDDTEFVVLDVNGNGDGDPEAKPHLAAMTASAADRDLMDITGRNLIRLYGKSGTGEAYKNALIRAGIGWSKKGACPSTGAGAYCPQVAVWAYAAPAPCSIWPF